MIKKKKAIEQKKYIIGMYKMMYAAAGNNIIMKAKINHQPENIIYAVTISSRKLKLFWEKDGMPTLFYDLSVVPIYLYLDNLVTNFNIALSKKDFERDNLKDLQDHKKDTSKIKFGYTNPIG